MTTQEILKQVLAKIDKPHDFMQWADQWYHDAPCWCGIFTDPRVWAFSAREMAIALDVGAWEDGCMAVANGVEYGRRIAPMAWMCRFGSAYHWILAGCIALEMKKEATS